MEKQGNGAKLGLDQKSHEGPNSTSTDADNNHTNHVTRSSRRVRKPARYRTHLCSCPEGLAFQQGGSCKARNPAQGTHASLGGTGAGVNRRVTGQHWTRVTIILCSIFMLIYCVIKYNK